MKKITLNLIGIGIPFLSTMKFEGESKQVTLDVPADVNFEEVNTRKGNKMHRAKVKIDNKAAFLTGWDVNAFMKDGVARLGTGMKLQLKKSSREQEGKTITFNEVSLVNEGTVHTEITVA